MSKNCKKRHFEYEDDENWYANKKKMQKKSQIKKERRNKQINEELMKHDVCVAEKKKETNCAFCAYWQKSVIDGICWRNSMPCDTGKNDVCSLFRRK